MLELDHIAVSAETVEAAAAAVEAALGVALQPGGRHDRFGTHNRLLGLADGLYLEAIAVDPEAPEPDRPRWFGLDRFSGPPRLSNWICRTRDLDGVLAALPGAGQAVALKRGDLAWSMAVPAAGGLPFDNLHPAVIRWECDIHPSAILKDAGCALRRLVVVHPEAGALRDLLAPVLRDARVCFEPGDPALLAEIATPHGLRVLQ
jgi:hypothetical protein